MKKSKSNIEFTYKTKGSKMMVEPQYLKPNPLNSKIYSNQQEETKTQQEIAESFRIRFENGLTPNEQPIIVYSDGLIDAGHTRWAAAKLANVSLWFELSESPYPDFNSKPYSTLEVVVGSNIYRKMTYSVKLNEFEEMNKAYAIEYGISRPRKDEDKHLAKLEISRDTITKLQEIKSIDSNLLNLIDKGEYTVKGAHDEATGKNKVKVVTSKNPNRDWNTIYTKEVFKVVMNRVSNCITQMMNISYKLDGEDFNPVMNDFVTAAKTANISWMTESITAEVLRKEGHNVRSATGHNMDADIMHDDIDDKVEVKVTNFAGPQTQWKGGMGIREGQYILIAYDEQIERWLVIFTKLTADDWKKNGMQHLLPIKNVYTNHSKDMKVIYGSVFENKGNVVAQVDYLN